MTTVTTNRDAVYVVTANDGRLFRCHVEQIRGIDQLEQHRWICVQSDGLQLIGPSIKAVRDELELQQAVSELWERKKAQFGANIS
jgi:hypothetical protein